MNRATIRIAGAAALLVALTSTLLAAFAPSLSLQYGLPPAGALIEAGLPAARLVAVIAAAGAVGCLLVAAVLVPGEANGSVSPLGYGGLCLARWFALTQGVASLAVAALSVAENSGIGPGAMLADARALLAGLEQIQPAVGWLLSGVLALAIAVLAHWALSWHSAVGLLLLALLAQLPCTLTAATNAQRSHDIAGDALALHVLGAVLWAGCAAATVVLAARGTADQRVRRRNNVLATGCLVLVGTSGLISSAYAIAPADLWASGYGLLVLAACVLLVLLAGVGALLRRPGGSTGRLAVLELVLLGASICVGTGLARLAPPAELNYQASREIYLLGYDLPNHLDWLDLATRWRPDLVFLPLALSAAALYLVGLRRLRAEGQRWPVRYTAAWLSGCAVLLIATSSGIGSYAPALFSVHMVQHMLLATVTPTLLVLGHGVTLALRASSAPVSARLSSLLRSTGVRLIGNPALAWVAVAATLFGLYPTGLYAAVLQQHWAHLTMDAAFFGTGVALFWAVLGRSHRERELPEIGQLVMVFAVMALHAVFSAWLLARPAPIAELFYTSLRLPFVPNLLADQRLGAILAWVLGEVPVILAVLALILRWTRQDRAPAAEGPMRAQPGPRVKDEFEGSLVE
jgi:putative copper resistance protein D